MPRTNHVTKAPQSELNKFLKKLALANLVTFVILSGICALLLSYFFDITSTKDYAAWITASGITALCPLFILNVLGLTVGFLIPELIRAYGDQGEVSAFMRSHINSSTHSDS